MSALLAPERHRGSRPPLKVVRGRRQRAGRLPFLLLLTLVLAAGMAGLLLLNTQLQSQAMEVRDAERRATDLSNQQARLEGEVELARSTPELARKASALGLRPNLHTVYLVLPDGTIVGEPNAVEGDELPSSVIKTPEQIEQERRAEEARKADEARKAEEARIAEEQRLEAERRHAEQNPPAPEGEQPAPEGEQPAPEGEQPAPEGEQPAPEGEPHPEQQPVDNGGQ
ncbi:hypothetical protein [Parenemella sanctibonifatiensis]|uniref:Cell division protein FtsL n=1 Tax=Parenemella sanctibonifatiensis TaxID=2016505 RepID=A0A255EE37_9ACTN|nr:hypothetical protein [Parenemella sanctibonifatiensis]OYN89827.1 hypothetical protein CGZ91_09965 [Parenemella sanctibonifatiensis]